MTSDDRVAKIAPAVALAIAVLATVVTFAVYYH
jgi:hypothetical protein